MKAEPIGYLFNGRFYKSIDDLRGKTMSEGNEPIPLHSKQQIIDAYTNGEINIVQEVKKNIPELDFTYTDLSILKIQSGIEPNESAEQYYNETFKP